MIEFRTLGAVGLRRRDGPELLSVLSQPKRTGLLAYLLLGRRGSFQRRDRLVALFWPDADDEHGRNSLRQSIHFLRRSLGDDVIESRGDDELGVGPGIWCDAAAFEAALEEGDVEGGLALYAGELLPGFFVEGAPDFERWLETERARLRGRAGRAAADAAQARERAGDGAGALELGGRALALAPEDAALVRAQMQRLERLSDSAGAIACYESHARRLLLEYELEPAAETRALADEIRARHNLAPAVAAAAPAPGRVPLPATAFAAESTAAAPAADMPRVAPARKRQRLAWAAVALFLAAGAGIAWLERPRGPAVDSRRVVVVPFENATGDSTMAPLGTLVADVLTQAVATSGFAEAVPPPPAPAGQGTPSRSAEQFARAARAGIVVTGRYFLVGDTVQVEAHAVALEGGEREMGVQAVRGTRQRPDSLVESVRDRLLGVLAAQMDRLEGDPALSSRGLRHPPTYAAYRAYSAGEALFLETRYLEAAAELRRAMSLDSSFHDVGTELFAALNNAGRTAAAESVLRALTPHRAELAPEARIDFEAELAAVDGDWARAYRVIRDLPGRTWFSNHDLAIVAIALRRPHEALRLLETGPPPEYVTGTERWSGFHKIKTDALFLAGDHEGELRAARRARELFPDLPNAVMYEGRALAALGRVDEAATRAETLLRTRPAMALDVIDVMATRDPAAAGQAYRRALTALEQAGDSSVTLRLRGRALLAVGRAAEARTTCEALRAHLPADPPALLCIGVAAARLGDRAGAAAAESALAALPGTAVSQAQNTLRRARIAAALGERERAVRLLADAYAGGQRYEPALLYTPEFAPLRGYAPFDELVRPLDR